VTTIVVPLDGSTFAARALRPACSLAARLDHSQVLLVTCGPDDAEVARRHLEDQAVRFRGVVEIDIRILEAGNPGEGILAAAEAATDSLLCMATHGRGGLRATVLGSVAKQVVSQSTRPLVLVGPECRTALLPGERGRLLACSDGSEMSDSIMSAVASWSVRLQLDPCLTEVVPPDEVAEQLPDQPSRNRQVDAARGRLDALSAQLQTEGLVPAGLTVTTEILHGHPETSIAAFAERLPAALIAMATHGRSGLSDVTIGSIATEVVRNAHCPVLVSRPPAPAH